VIVCLSSFTFIHSEPQKYGKVVRYSHSSLQGHRNWYQFKANMRLPISLPLHIMHIFYHFRHSPQRIIGKKSAFSAFTPICGIGTCMLESLCYQSGSDNCTILRLLVLTQYQCVTGRRTDTPPNPMSRCSTAERDRNVLAA